MKTASQEQKKIADFKWTETAPLPDNFGFAGTYAGVSNNALLVAGGANFPDGGAPWTGSRKVWTDKIFVLEKPGGQWKLAGKLPQALGYGVSVTWNNRVVCIGGSNADTHVTTVFSLCYNGTEIIIENLPDLPGPLANSCGVLLGDVIYVAGGTAKPDAQTTMSTFWSLDLSGKGSNQWQQLESWPGPPRMLSVAGAHKGSFYLFSGTELQTNHDQQVQRNYLKDAYKFSPGRGWTKLADLPHPVVAAPTPAYSGENSFLVFGGDDGSLAPQASILRQNHPGFSDKIMCYDVNVNRWSISGKLRTDKREDAGLHPNKSLWAPVTVPMVIWEGNLIFPSGEVRPAVRTPRVLVASLNNLY